MERDRKEPYQEIRKNAIRNREGFVGIKVFQLLGQSPNVPLSRWEIYTKLKDEVMPSYESDLKWLIADQLKSLEEHGEIYKSRTRGKIVYELTGEAKKAFEDMNTTNADVSQQWPYDYEA